MSRNPLLRGLLICAGLLLQAQVALACQCGQRPTVLDSYEKWDVVMIARVRSIHPDEVPARFRHLLGGVYAATTVVEKVYKGNVRVGDEILFQQGATGCGMTFTQEDLGKQFLFYMDAPQVEPFLMQVSFCERSGLLTSRKEDLLYLDNMEKVRGKTRVSGNSNLPNQLIRIVGENQTYETKTDEDGVYEIYDLPPGKYRLEPEMPKGWRIAERSFRYLRDISLPEPSSKTLSFTIRPQRHVTIDVEFKRDNEP